MAKILLQISLYRQIAPAKWRGVHTTRKKER
jgi:hypothetical protein